MLFILSDLLLPSARKEKISLASDPFHAHFVWLVNTLRMGLLNCLNARSWGLIQSEVRFL
jgi:hypothetical protein